KLTVISTSEAATRQPMTTRRLKALGRVEEEPEVADRCTGEPSTATRAVRLRGTSGLSLAGSEAAYGCAGNSRASGRRRQAPPYLLRPLRRERARARWLFFIASNSSRLRPEPTATQVSGESARWVGMCVS